MRLSPVVLLSLLLVSGLAGATVEKADDYHWSGVERIVAIGDLHGDYAQYMAVMQSAGLIDKNAKWSGGRTHLVQTGDIADRGADSRKIIDHLVKLARQARIKGGYVHMLIGNHEAMNVVGDLRYVTKDEFKAFTTRNSRQLQDMQWSRQVEWMRTNILAFEELNLDFYRKEWEQWVPLGWVEHRQGWGLNGQYGKWLKNNPVAIQINDTIFLHGGISAKYCKFSLQSLTEQVIAAMESYKLGVLTIVEDPLGPIWYRGLAMEKEADVFSHTLDNILNRYGAERVVVGHTPTGGIIWPRFDQRVIVNDPGIAVYYGSHKGVLELTEDAAVAIYGDQRIPLPAHNNGREDYLRAVIETDLNNTQLRARLARMVTPLAENPDDPATLNAGDQVENIEAVVAQVIVGTCQ